MSQFVVHVTPEMIRHSRILDAIYFGGFFYSCAVLVIVLRSGISARIRDVATRLAKRPFLVAAIWFAIFSLVTTLFEFPLSFYAGFIVPHQFDLTNQTFASWLGDFAKEFGVDVLIGAFVAVLAIECLRRVRRWWIVMWLGSIPLIILGVIITPLVIDPLFNKFEPLKDVQLRNDLLAEASRAGIEGSRVYEVDKSKQTKEMNAYVTGIGPSARIVLWDTLLKKMTHDEILATMGHEMGHYALHHIWKGVAFGIAVSFFGFLVAQIVYERGLRWWGLTDRADPAALAWLILAGAVITFLLSPVTNGFSRHVEHEADRFGLELTHLNEATATSFVKFAEDSKRDPNPPRFIEWWRYTHPSAQHRIDFALSYRPWELHPSRRVAQPLDQQLAKRD